MSDYVRRGNLLFNRATAALVGYVDGNGAEQSIAPPAALNYPPNLYWRGAMAKLATARARGPNSPPRILFNGDSVTTGAGANGASYFNCRALGFVVRMATTLGWQTGTFFGDQNATTNGATIQQYDPRIGAFEGSWQVTNPAATFGGCFINSPGATGVLRFTPGGPAFDKVRVWFPTDAGFSNAVNVLADGVVVGTFNMQTNPGPYQSATFNVPRSTRQVGIQGSQANGSVYVGGIETWDSTSSAPILLVGGWSGATLANMADVSGPWTNLNAVVAIKPDVVVLQADINDSNQTTPTAIATMSGLYDAYCYAVTQAGADIVLNKSWPINQANQFSGYGDQIASIERLIASAFGGAFVDFRAVFGDSYNLAATLRGLGANPGVDMVHPGYAGHTLMMNMLSPVFAL